MNFLKTFLCRISAAALLFTIFNNPALSQDTPKSLMSLARKQAALGKGQAPEEKIASYKKAITMYGEVVSKWPESTTYGGKSLIEAAALEKRLGNHKSAIALLEKVAELGSPSDIQADAYLALASIHRKLKSSEKATAVLLALLERCKDRGKDCARARLIMGSMARSEKRYLDAMQHARDVMEKNPTFWRENVDAVQLFVSILIKCHRWQEASSELARLEAELLKRFAQSDQLASLEKALKKLPARRILTPSPVTNG